MGTPTITDEKKQTGLRLRQSRLAIARAKNLPQFNKIKPFAVETGTDEDNLSNWELGKAFPQLWYIQGLKDRWGITFDWIFGDDKAGLPGWLIEALGPTSTPKLKAIKGGRHK